MKKKKIFFFEKVFGGKRFDVPVLGVDSLKPFDTSSINGIYIV